MGLFLLNIQVEGLLDLDCLRSVNGSSRAQLDVMAPQSNWIQYQYQPRMKIKGTLFSLGFQGFGLTRSIALWGWRHFYWI